MTLSEGRRVKLVEDLRLAGQVVRAVGPSTERGTEPREGQPAGFLALAAGAEGVVESVDEHRREKSEEAGEYERLKSLLDDFGHQMPPGSRQQLEEQVGALEPAWDAYQEQLHRVTVRVRFDNGFVLDDAPADVFATT